jgi:hypothetical protein
MYVLLRGNPRAKGRMVLPGYPSVVADGGPADLAGLDKRLALARWIASPDNPLTARVIANRLWQFHFGRGIVDTPNDFGAAGSKPTHPELLDWLASELIDRGWRLKSMHRLILLSATYRMSSAGDKLALATDPQNRLFWRYDLRRLTAEEIRDSMLWTADVLNEKMFGAPVFIPLPPEVLATASNAGARWGKSPLDESCRRTIYVKVKRSLRPPLLTNFDAADTDSRLPRAVRVDGPHPGVGDAQQPRGERAGGRLRAAPDPRRAPQPGRPSATGSPPHYRATAVRRRSRRRREVPRRIADRRGAHRPAGAGNVIA